MTCIRITVLNWPVCICMKVSEEPAVPQILVCRRQAVTDWIQCAALHSGGQLWRNCENADQWTSHGKAQVPDQGTYYRHDIYCTSSIYPSMHPSIHLTIFSHFRSMWSTMVAQGFNTLPWTPLTSLQQWVKKALGFTTLIQR